MAAGPSQLLPSCHPRTQKVPPQPASSATQPGRGWAVTFAFVATCFPGSSLLCDKGLGGRGGRSLLPPGWMFLPVPMMAGDTQPDPAGLGLLSLTFGAPLICPSTPALLLPALPAAPGEPGAGTRLSLRALAAPRKPPLPVSSLCPLPLGTCPLHLPGWHPGPLYPPAVLEEGRRVEVGIYY